jgi:hypothetical protein
MTPGEVKSALNAVLAKRSRVGEGRRALQDEGFTYRILLTRFFTT